MKTSKRTKITRKMIMKSYEISKDYFHKRISRDNAKNILVNSGMNENSASDSVYILTRLLSGKMFTRHHSQETMEYFFDKILIDYGYNELEIAIKSELLHLDYMENKKNVTYSSMRNSIYEYQIINPEDIIPFAEDIKETLYSEGKSTKISINRFERNYKARKKCLEIHGVICKTCKFDFYKVYGNLGKEYIHVHHIKEISTIGEEYKVDPENDLIPICPNCHSMLHKIKPAMRYEDLIQIIEKHKQGIIPIEDKHD